MGTETSEPGSTDNEVETSNLVERLLSARREGFLSIFCSSFWIDLFIAKIGRVVFDQTVLQTSPAVAVRAASCRCVRPKARVMEVVPRAP